MPKGSKPNTPINWYGDPMQGGYYWPGVIPDAAGQPQGAPAGTPNPVTSPGVNAPGQPGQPGQYSADQYSDAMSKQYTNATNIYENMAAQPIIYPESGQMPNQGVIPGPGQNFQSGMDTWRYGSPADIRRRDEQRFGTGGGGRAAAGGYNAPTGPTGPPPTLDLGNIQLDLPEYKPPTENKNVRKEAFEEVYQRGRGDMQRQVHNAIISAKSIDNPAARQQMISSVLQGMGSGLNEIAKAAGSAANQKAAMKRAEQLQIYNAQYQAQSAEAKAGYDRDMMEAMQNFQNEMLQWQNGTGPGGTNTNADFVGANQKRENGQLYEWRGPNAGWVAVRG